MLQNNTLIDEKFLTALSEQKEREIYARITALDINENPLEQIEGKVTGGSVNIDGNSSVRRTCSLTLVNDSKNINEYIWGVKTKFRLEIGLRNQLIGDYGSGQYPEIVWFPQGIYIITSFNTSISTNNSTISISGKDKMCLLNGDISGQLFASIDFGTEEIVEPFVELAQIELASSDVLMQKRYYIEIEDQETIIDNNQTISIGEENKPLYRFVKNQEKGKYYKEKNTYKLLTEEKSEGVKYYNIYKLVQSPSELFEEIEFYESGKYYYIENNNYSLDNSVNLTSDRIYYKNTESEENYYPYIAFLYYTTQNGNKSLMTNSIASKFYYQNGIDENQQIIYTEVQNSDIFDETKAYYYMPAPGQYVRAFFKEYKIGKYYYYDNGQMIISYEEYPLLAQDYYKVKDKIKLQNSYESNKYYYDKDNTNYYILDSRSNKDNNIQYYQLKFLYNSYNSITKKEIPIEKIVREAVHQYAKEPYHNIIIKDLGKYGLEQLTYKGDTPIYALYNVETDNYDNLILEENNENFTNIISSSDFQFNPLISSITSDVGSKILENNKEFLGIITGENIYKKYYKIIVCDKKPSKFESGEAYLIYNPNSVYETETIDEKVYNKYKVYTDDENFIIVVLQKNLDVEKIFSNKLIAVSNNYLKNGNDNTYTIVKIEYGDDIGYRLTDLTYTGDLITNIGDKLTTMLDKIKTMLGNFEYFYDVNGKFIFQEKQNYVNSSWSQLVQDKEENYVDFANNKSKFSYRFEGNNLISAIQNNPTLTNLSNDFIVWGKRKGVSGTDLSIHGRYAIDKKPRYYKSLDNKIYLTNEEYLTEDDIKEFRPNSEIMKKINNFNTYFLNTPQASITLNILNKINNSDATPGFNSTDGIYGAGWWDIRDWRDYYKILKNNKNPNGTMKFYSTDGDNGYQHISELLGSGSGDTWFVRIENNNNNNTYGLDFSYSYEASGLGNPVMSNYYETPVDEKGHYIKNGNQVVTVRVEGIQKDFDNPRKWDLDEHTYTYFLDQIGKQETIQGQTVTTESFIFYNPSFPFGETAKDLIDSQVKREYFIQQEEKSIFLVDWREIIYQMASDCLKAQGCSEQNPIYIKDDNNQETIMTNPEHLFYEIAQRNPYYYPTGQTGYEQYYTDMFGENGFWRQLYNPNYVPEEVYSEGEYKEGEQHGAFDKKTKIWVPPQLIDYNIDYYVGSNKEDIQAQINKLESLLSDEDIDETRYNELYQLREKYNKYLVDFNDGDFTRRLYWNRKVFEAPETLNFWIEFLDSDQELAQFSVPQVGDRTKVVNDDKANAIIYTEVPSIILYEKGDKEKAQEKIKDIDEYGDIFKTGYQYMNIPIGMSQYFTISYRTHSVKDKIDELLYQHSYCIENITITALPIYHLQPNTRIYVKDEDTGIDGEYIISKITLSLSYNGTMSITAVKAPQRLY